MNSITKQSVDGGGSTRRGAWLLFSASLASQGAALVRYVILARLLGPEQLGLAAALTVTGAFFDRISDTGSDRFLVQDRYGEATELQNLIQFVNVGRGGLVAASLAIFAIPIAYFYNSPRLAEGLAIMAIAPLVSGFLHLDVFRNQRNHDFRSEAICVIAAETSGLAVTTIAAWQTHDFKAVAYGLIARAIVWVIGSHFQAQRPFRLKWESKHAVRLARFSIPLTMNGLVLFLFSQSDRLIIGRELGMTTLGYYSAIIASISFPSNALAGYIQRIYVPMIAARRQWKRDQERLSDRLGGQTLILTLIMAVGFAVVAPVAVPALFGRQFAQPALLIALVGILQSTRFFLSWPTTTALALGRSSTVLTSNLVHFLTFPAAFIGLRLTNDISGIVLGYIGAEMIATAVALVQLNRVMGRRHSFGLERFGAVLLTCITIAGWTLALQAKQWGALACMLLVTVPLVIWVYSCEAATITDFFRWRPVRFTFELFRWQCRRD